MRGAPPVALDLVAAQSPSYRNRGIARHGLAFTEAVLARHADLIGSVLLHPELPPVSGLDPIIASGKSVPWHDWGGDEVVFHLTSAFEPEVRNDRLWPRRAAARGAKLAVTVYDLIPDVFPDVYLMDPGLRRRWRAGRELVRMADHVFALSESGADDVARLLGVAESRISVIGAGCDERFHPGPADEARKQAQQGVPELGDHYLVYNGAIDPRKNMERLVHAFAALPPGLRERYQLVLVCRVAPLERNHFMVMAEQLGIDGRVVMPGFVTDDLLAQLYRSADLVVFPSLYEGFGLPVVEAMACGAPVVVADNSSLRELVADYARFDATDVQAIAAAMERPLSDPRLHARLVEASAVPPPGWGAVADRAAETYERLAGSGGAWSGWTRRPVLAVVAPPSPSTAPAAAGAAAVLAELRQLAEVDVFTDGPPGPTGPAIPAATLAGADRARGGYDGIVVWAGDHPDHAGAARLLATPEGLPQPPVVVATGASQLGALAAAFPPEELAELAARLYPGSDPGDVASPERLDASGYVLARSAITASRRYLVTSAEAAARLRVDAAPGQSDRVGTVDVPPAGDWSQVAQVVLAAALAGDDERSPV